MTDQPIDRAAFDRDQQPEQRAYLLKRANDHRQLAVKAIEPTIRSVHLLLQQLYENRATTPEPVLPD